jgi:hypothetical protein
MLRSYERYTISLTDSKTDWSIIEPEEGADVSVERWIESFEHLQGMIEGQNHQA